MESKSVVTKSRKWNNPNILAWVNNEEIGMGMSLDDYLTALAAEIGNPAFVMTQAGLLKRMKEASATVEAEMHEKSTTVI